MRPPARLLAAAFLAALAVHPAGADDGWLVNRFASTIAIRPTGELDVHEAIDVDFGHTAHHGIYRDLTELFSYDATRNRRYSYVLLDVMDARGQNQPVHTSQEGALERFRIGNPNHTLTGPAAYRLHYRVLGALNPFPDHDELYWNATGRWTVRLAATSVTIQAPAGAITRVACFEGGASSTEPCAARSTPDAATFTASRPLQAGEQLTVVVGLNKGAVADVAPILVAKPRPFLQFFDHGPVLLAAAGLGLLAAIGGVGALWWRVGRDRRYIALQPDGPDAAQERVPIFGGRPIAVAFEPPEHIRPAQVGLLIDERADTLDVTATIIDLAVRGYLKITELAKKGWFGHTDWQLDRLKAADDQLLDYERIVLDGLFDGATTRTLSDLKNKFYKDLARAKDALYADGVKRGWFPRNPSTVRALSVGGGILSMAAGVALVFWLGQHFGAGLLGLPLVAAGLLLVLAARAMPRRTAAGQAVTGQALGFARYIRTAEAHQQAFAERAQIFTAYLPYAIVFKCVDRWARAFKDIDLQAATAGWYAGTAAFNAAAFSSNVSSFSTSVSSAIASTPGGSGGSGFSGGSAGGGGGGGGGGGW